MCIYKWLFLTILINYINYITKFSSHVSDYIAQQYCNFLVFFHPFYLQLFIDMSSDTFQRYKISVMEIKNKLHLDSTLRIITESC